MPQESDFRKRGLTADQLDKVLSEGTNITITKIDNCTLEISSTGGSAQGVKWHIKAGETVTVPDCYQYILREKLLIDATATFQIDSGGQLVIEDGILCNDGTLINDGEIIYT